MLLSTGFCQFNSVIIGEVIIVDKTMDYVGKTAGKIIVCKSPTPNIYLLMNDSLLVITETGGLACHVAILANELGKPCIVGASSIVEKVSNGQIIKAIGRNGKGEIYAY